MLSATNKEDVIDEIAQTSYVMRGIPAFLVARMWPFALPYVKRVLDRMAGELTTDDILQSCQSNDMQLWLVANDVGRVVGAGITELVHYPRRFLCRIVALSGSNFAEWAKSAHTVLENWARQQGCDGIEAWVRRGYVPKLKEMGYQFRFTAVIKDIPTIIDTSLH